MATGFHHKMARGGILDTFLRHDHVVDDFTSPDLLKAALGIPLLDKRDSLGKKRSENIDNPFPDKFVSLVKINGSNEGFKDILVNVGMEPMV